MKRWAWLILLLPFCMGQDYGAGIALVPGKPRSPVIYMMDFNQSVDGTASSCGDTDEVCADNNSSFSPGACCSNDGDITCVAGDDSDCPLEGVYSFWTGPTTELSSGFGLNNLPVNTSGYTDLTFLINSLSGTGLGWFFYFANASNTTYCSLCVDVTSGNFYLCDDNQTNIDDSTQTWTHSTGVQYWARLYFHVIDASTYDCSIVIRTDESWGETSGAEASFKATSQAFCCAGNKNFERFQGGATGNKIDGILDDIRVCGSHNMQVGVPCGY